MIAWTNLLRLEDRVLDSIDQHPGSTRSSLVDSLGISRSALGRALDGLIATGAVVVGGRSVPSGPGRPVTYLSLAPNRGFSVGIDVGRSRCVALVRDRRGAVLVRARASVQEFSDWREPLQRVARLLVEEAQFRQVDLTGIQCTGVGLPIPVFNDFDTATVQRVLDGALDRGLDSGLSPDVVGGWPEVAHGSDQAGNAGSHAGLHNSAWPGLIHVRNNVFVEALAQTASTAQSPCQMFVRISGGIGSCLVLTNTQSIRPAPSAGHAGPHSEHAGVSAGFGADVQPVDGGTRVFGAGALLTDADPGFEATAQPVDGARSVSTAQPVDGARSVSTAQLAYTALRAVDVRHFHLLAGELGHIPVSVSDAWCHCGRRGCAETVASVTAICQAAGVEGLQQLQQAFDGGQPAASHAIQLAATALTQVFTAAALSARLDMIVLGGALVEAIPDLLVQIQNALPKQFPPSIGFIPNVVAANADPVMGALGAALAAETRQQARRLTQAQGIGSM